MFKEFGMKPAAIRAYAYLHSIPTKKKNGITYYSKIHLTKLRQMDMITDERYCTAEYVSEKYELSKANIHHNGISFSSFAARRTDEGSKNRAKLV